MSFLVMCERYRDVLDEDFMDCMKEYDQKELDSRINDQFNDNINVVGSFHSYLKKYDLVSEKFLCVSLSGGVDSMISTFILHHLKRKHDYKYIIVVIHIEHNNREESSREAMFVEYWAQFMRFKYVYKKVDPNLKRGVTPRKMYELETRKIRFDLYREVVEFYKLKGIMLGHMKGDVCENVFSNFMNQRSLLDLPVIDEVTVVEGISLQRPLIYSQKKEIFDFAHQFFIPYFKNTTPKWSCRGRMRNEIFPQLESHFGKSVIDNLFKRRNECNDLMDMLSYSVYNPFFRDNVKIGRLGVEIDSTTPFEYNTTFWRHVFTKIFNGMGEGGLSVKALKNFFSTLEDCRKDLKGRNILLKGGWRTFIWVDNSYPLSSKLKLIIINSKNDVKIPTLMNQNLDSLILEPDAVREVLEYKGDNVYQDENNEEIIQPSRPCTLEFDKKWQIDIWRVYKSKDNDSIHLPHGSNYNINVMDGKIGYFIKHEILVDKVNITPNPPKQFIKKVCPLGVLREMVGCFPWIVPSYPVRKDYSDGTGILYFISISLI